jgi:hypothetical protein
MNVNDQVNTLVQSIISDVIAKIKDQAEKQVVADINRYLAQIDFNQMIKDTVGDHLSKKLTEFTFPEASIPGPAIDLSTFVISGDSVKSGIIENFGSTGIQDSATECRITILDEATIVSNNLIVKDAEVKGSLTIDGDFILHGEIPPDSPFLEDVVSLAAGRVSLALNDTLFEKFSGIIFDKILENGIDLTKISIEGRSAIEGNTLGTFITESNIQKVGELRKLTVSGESQFANTVYVGNKRMGINTIEPAGALAVWDEECEIVVRKLQKDTPIIGSVRNQAVVLSSNNQSNLTLETDGTVSVKTIKVGQVQLSSAADRPSHIAKKGTVVFNENPEVGKPVGWVSLGNANWTQFGVVG